MLVSNIMPTLTAKTSNEYRQSMAHGTQSSYYPIATNSSNVCVHFTDPFIFNHAGCYLHATKPLMSVHNVKQKIFGTA